MNKTYNVIKLDHKEIDSESEVRYLQAIFITEDKALAETLLTYSPLPLVGCELELSDKAVEVAGLNSWVDTSLTVPMSKITGTHYDTKTFSTFEYLDLLTTHPEIVDQLEDLQLLFEDELNEDDNVLIEHLVDFFDSHEFFQEMDFQEDEETV
ncbi:hypothetical protein OTK59_14420 [Vibrio natriegens]|uniref:hypothetical protein n=1 Tax=Vibrio natriegens TaxID=691 RepID=UPI0022834FAC|nr:hypothetical protein [Vibrio natriegens]MCY9877748.1 hypothetical protein [Vibrio natriegens]